MLPRATPINAEDNLRNIEIIVPGLAGHYARESGHIGTMVNEKFTLLMRYSHRPPVKRTDSRP